MDGLKKMVAALLVALGVVAFAGCGTVSLPADFPTNQGSLGPDNPDSDSGDDGSADGDGSGDGGEGAGSGNAT